MQRPTPPGFSNESPLGWHGKCRMGNDASLIDSSTVQEEPSPSSHSSPVTVHSPIYIHNIPSTLKQEWSPSPHHNTTPPDLGNVSLRKPPLSCTSDRSNTPDAEGSISAETVWAVSLDDDDQESDSPAEVKLRKPLGDNLSVGLNPRRDRDRHTSHMQRSTTTSNRFKDGVPGVARKRSNTEHVPSPRNHEQSREPAGRSYASRIINAAKVRGHVEKSKQAAAQEARSLSPKHRVNITDDTTPLRRLILSQQGQRSTAALNTAEEQKRHDILLMMEHYKRMSTPVTSSVGIPQNAATLRPMSQSGEHRGRIWRDSFDDQ